MSDGNVLTRECLREQYRMSAKSAKSSRVDDSHYFDDFTEIEDAAAMTLGRFKGLISLNGLSFLSDTAAECLGNRRMEEGNYALPVKGEVRRGPHLKGGLHLDGLTSLSDDAAESLKNTKGSLFLNGVMSLSENAAKSLGKHKGGGLLLEGLVELPDKVAKGLAKKKGQLYLRGLKSLTDDAAEALAKQEDLVVGDEIEKIINKYR